MVFTPDTVWLKLLNALLSSNTVRIIREIVGVLQRLRYAPGLYEVLEQQIRLTLKDEAGKYASYYKQQRVRFLQDYVIAFQDTLWGDGDIFRNYRCSPGKSVDRYREGHRYRVLISLRETKQRGDIENFRISRDIRNGFLATHEYLQTDINHQTHNLAMRVTFPLKRPPRAAWITQENTSRTNQLAVTSFQVLPDGRVQISWQNEKPILHESYILSWEW